MKTWFILALTGFVNVGVAQSTPPEPVPAAATTADAEWQKIQTLKNPPLPTPPPRSQIEYTTWLESQFHLLQKTGLEFFAHYPTDPRRWDALAVIMTVQPRYFKSYLPDFEQAPAEMNAVMDEEGLAAWRAKKKELAAMINAAPDASEAAREMAALVPLKLYYETTKPLDPVWIEAEILRVAAQFPQGDQTYFATRQAILEIERAHRRGSPEREQDLRAAQAVWTGLLQTPHRRIREAAEGIRRVTEAKEHPIEMQFTALDGREVDLKALRGKVVLIEFWAMWCAPCVEEIPNLKAVYDKYHAQGFEIIGIQQDSANARNRLVEFLKKKEITWPQFFDGKGSKNEITIRYGVQSIPTMFLLDQTGRLVSTSARGPALEREVKRLLATPAQPET